MHDGFAQMPTLPEILKFLFLWSRFMPLFIASVSFCCASLFSLSLSPALSTNDFMLILTTVEALAGITFVYSNFFSEHALTRATTTAINAKRGNKLFFI